MTSEIPEFDLIVIGGTPAGMSLAADAQANGLGRVLILERSDTVVPQEAVGRLRLNVRYQTHPSVVRAENGAIRVETEDVTFRAVAVAYTQPLPGKPIEPPYPIPASLADRIHFDCGDVPGGGSDVLVVGTGEQATSFAQRLTEQGHRVVLALIGNFNRLSQLSRETLTQLEQTRRATILWNSAPDAIDDVGGYPMAYFDDRRTPDLQFDHVVYALGLVPSDTAITDIGVDESIKGRGFFVLLDDRSSVAGPDGWAIEPGSAWDAIRSARFPSLLAPHQTPSDERRTALAARHYNATITYFQKTHSDLWRIRVKPDAGNADHRAGQYATLGLGYWEPRIDHAVDRLKEGQIEKLARRSYSISSPIFDEHGYLVSPYESDELEFYVVLVPASDERIPGLTPRLALKNVGDRLYLGPKISGRYTLDSVTDPSSTVLFLATGTGEAPHNAMIVELLRRGHYGSIVSAVSVRNWSDLAYRDAHTELVRRYSNYHYLSMPTREPDIPKRYIQSVIESGELDQRLGLEIDPANTSVFLCGNPAMIGPPTWEGDQPSFPSPKGVVEILYHQGFIPDRRTTPGNVHFEEYW